MLQDAPFSMLGNVLNKMTPSVMKSLKESNEDYFLYGKIEEMLKTSNTAQVNELLLALPDKMWKSRVKKCIKPFKIIFIFVFGC